MKDFTLNEMLEMQKALQEKYKHKWSALTPEQGRHQLLWMIIAFFIMLLTTKWSMITGDKESPLMAGVTFMISGVIASLICGIGPALVLRKREKSGWIYAFPLALLLVGVSGAVLWELTQLSVFSYAVLICTFPAAPIYNCLVFNHSPLFDYMANALVFIAPLLYALVIYLASIVSRKRTLQPIQL